MAGQNKPHKTAENLPTNLNISDILKYKFFKKNNEKQFFFFNETMKNIFILNFLISFTEHMPETVGLDISTPS